MIYYNLILANFNLKRGFERFRIEYNSKKDNQPSSKSLKKQIFLLLKLFI
jgi:hypothetical protein